MASDSFDTAYSRPDQDISLEFRGVPTLDIVSEAEQITRNECLSLPRKMLAKIGNIARRNSVDSKQGWKKKEKAATTRTLVHVLQVATDKALQAPDKYGTLTSKDRVNFSFMAPSGNKYVVDAKHQNHDLGLPTSYTVQQYENFQAESVRDITLHLEPSARYGVAINRQDLALSSQTPYVYDDTVATARMHGVIADVIEA